MVEQGLPTPGGTVAGKYEVVRLVGGGGMGFVYEAKHIRLQRRVAIKFLRPELVGDADSVARFDREARHSAELTSRFAARVLDVDATPEGVPYIVTEFLEGNNLEEEIRSRGPLPVKEAVGYLLAACSAMAEAHERGIVHRDLKPSNIFLAQSGKTRVVKVVDFGISKALRGEDVDLTSTGTVVGSPRYMAPEQVVSTRLTDPRSDIWSLGIVLYRALTETFPFAGETAMVLAVKIVMEPPVPISKHRDDLPPGLADVVMRTLEKDPDKRFATITDLARALEPFGSLPSTDGPADSMRELRAESLSKPPAVRAPAAAPGRRVSESEPTRALEATAPRGAGTKRTRVLALAAAAGLVGIALLGFTFVRNRESDARMTSAAIDAPSLHGTTAPASAGVEPSAAQVAPPPSIAVSIMTSASPSASTSGTATASAGTTTKAPRPPTTNRPRPPPAPAEDNPRRL